MNLKIWYFILKQNLLKFKKVSMFIIWKIKKKFFIILKFTLKFKQKISISKKISKKEINFLFYLFKKLKIYIQKGNLFPLLLFKKNLKKFTLRNSISKGSQFPFLIKKIMKKERSSHTTNYLRVFRPNWNFEVRLDAKSNT